MVLPKRTALYLALAVIVAGWVRRIYNLRAFAVIPNTFGELVRTIVIGKIVVAAILILLLRLQRQGAADIGLRREHWLRQIITGTAIGLAMFLALNVALDSAMRAIFPVAPTTDPSINVYFADPRHLLAWLPIGIFGGGVVEELERIFVFTRFEQWLGRPGLMLGVILSSAMFGLGHLYQGIGAVISTGISGVVFALVYLRRRSALEAISAHAFSDVLAMLGATFMMPHT
ncbi:MAG: CPBP family intramembrane glutamic endopeptidase [Gemmatimonadales bacterium]